MKSRNCDFFNGCEHLEETLRGNLILQFRKIKSPTQFYHSLLVILSVFHIHQFIDLHVLTDLLNPPDIH